TPPPPTTPPSPYTALFRSYLLQAIEHGHHRRGADVQLDQRAGEGRRHALLAVGGLQVVAVRVGRIVVLASGGFPTKQEGPAPARSDEHTSELQSRENLVCR